MTKDVEILQAEVERLRAAIRRISEMATEGMWNVSVISEAHKTLQETPIDLIPVSEPSRTF